MLSIIFLEAIPKYCKKVNKVVKNVNIDFAYKWL
jgi:hypothetical protein